MVILHIFIRAKRLACRLQELPGDDLRGGLAHETIHSKYYVNNFRYRLQ
jgi:hypothetical protein